MTLLTEYPVKLRLAQPPEARYTDEQFFFFCQANPDLQFERDAEGGIVVMSPAGMKGSGRNARITSQLLDWADRDGTGFVTDSSGAFILPNGATRAPDAAWTRNDKVEALPDDEFDRFPHIVPGFVIELRSPSDTLADQMAKMEEYRANGVPLGWLLDPPTRTVRVYRAGEAGVEVIVDPPTMAGEPLLPGFVLDLGGVW